MYWGKTLFLGQRELDVESKLKVDQLILAARDARNKAATRLVSHQRVCALCRRDKITLVKK
jgi:hypothetical protein